MLYGLPRPIIESNDNYAHPTDAQDDSVSARLVLKGPKSGTRSHDGRTYGIATPSSQCQFRVETFVERSVSRGCRKPLNF